MFRVSTEKDFGIFSWRILVVKYNQIEEFGCIKLISLLCYNQSMDFIAFAKSSA